MTWLALVLILNCNWYPNQNISFYEYNNQPVNYLNTFQIDFGMELKLFNNFIFIRGSNSSYFHKDKVELFDFYPNFQHYNIAVGLRYGNFEIGYEHNCFHPVIGYIPADDYDYKLKYEGANNKIYFSFKGEVFKVGE